MRLGSRAKLTMGIGLAAAALFGFLGVRDLMDARSEPEMAVQTSTAPGAPAPASVVLAAATRMIRTGETITADMIRNAALDPGRHPGVALPAEAIGQVATRDIPANTLIPRAVLGRESNLAIRVPVGMRAISIDTTAEIAVAGLVRPGDRVDVQVVYPGEDAIAGARGSGSSRARTLLQMVPILAVGELVVGTPAAQGIPAAVAGTVAGSRAPPPSIPAIQTARTVTLALTPPQVAELSLAKNVGALTLSLRNPDDREQVAVAQIASSPIRTPAPVTPQVVTAPVQQVAMQAPPRPARRAPAPARHAIELVVGGNHGVIYSGSGVQ